MGRPWPFGSGNLPANGSGALAAVASGDLPANGSGNLAATASGDLPASGSGDLPTSGFGILARFAPETPGPSGTGVRGTEDQGTGASPLSKRRREGREDRPQRLQHLQERALDQPRGRGNPRPGVGDRPACLGAGEAGE